MESPNPKVALTELLLEQHVSMSTAEAEDEAHQVLRDELKGLKLLALQKQAASAGIADEDIEEAMESDNPKGALVELLLVVSSATLRGSAASAADIAQQALCDELNDLKLMALQKRAASAGVTDTELEDAMEADCHRFHMVERAGHADGTDTLPCTAQQLLR